MLNYSKTEDTNKAPAAPRPRLLFSFPKLGKLVPYAGLGYVPPITVFDTRNVIVSGELGVGVPLENGLQLGGRYHATLMKTIIDGVLADTLPINLILIGVAIALVVEMMGLPSLALAVGLYLPLGLSTPIMVGGFIRWLVERRLVGEHKEKAESGLRQLPGNLGEAIAAFRADSVVRESLPSHVVERFIAAKSEEWSEYIASVSGWEVDRYIND